MFVLVCTEETGHFWWMCRCCLSRIHSSLIKSPINKNVFEKEERQKRNKTNEVILTTWFPLHTLLNILATYFSLCCSRSQNFVSDGVGLIDFGKFPRVCHGLFSEEKLLSHHSVKTCLTLFFIDGCLYTMCSLTQVYPFTCWSHLGLKKIIKSYFSVSQPDHGKFMAADRTILWFLST